MRELNQEFCNISILTTRKIYFWDILRDIHIQENQIKIYRGNKVYIKRKELYSVRKIQIKIKHK